MLQNHISIPWIFVAQLWTTKSKIFAFVIERPSLPNRIHYTIRLPLWSSDSPKTASTWDTRELYRTGDDTPFNFFYRNCSLDTSEIISVVTLQIEDKNKIAFQ